MDNLDVSYDGEVWVDLTTSLGAKHNDYGPNNERDLLDPDNAKIQILKRHLMNTFKQEPDEKILNLYLVASHGMVAAGQQTVVVDEYDAKTRFYRLFTIEYWIRKFAKDFPNTHHVVIFACCR